VDNSRATTHKLAISFDIHDSSTTTLVAMNVGVTSTTARYVVSYETLGQKKQYYSKDFIMQPKSIQVINLKHVRDSRTAGAGGELFCLS
jgi:hypothetical protein